MQHVDLDLGLFARRIGLLRQDLPGTWQENNANGRTGTRNSQYAEILTETALKL